MSSVRVDKWLWAARFFKTRAKAKEAIDGGKVSIDTVFDYKQVFKGYRINSNKVPSRQ